VDDAAEGEEVVGMEFRGDLGIIALFPSSRAREETDWRWRQSRANRSPGPIPCYQGLIQGFFMGFAENALASSAYLHESK